MRRPDLADLERAVDAVRSAATAGETASRYEHRILENLAQIARRERLAGPALRAASQARLAALLGRDAPLDALEAELCRRLAAGEIDAGSQPLMQHLRAEAIERLDIDNPGYWSLAAAKGRANG